MAKKIEASLLSDESDESSETSDDIEISEQG